MNSPSRKRASDWTAHRISKATPGTFVIAASIEKVAERAPVVARDDVKHHLATAQTKLLAARSLRVRPGLDDKILTAWNALAIAGAARSARRLASRPLLAEAMPALDFLFENVWLEGRLYACHAGGEAKFPAYLDDHAFVLDALLAMLQSTLEPARSRLGNRTRRCAARSLRGSQGWRFLFHG